MALLEVRHLRKSFGALNASDDLSLSVEPGEAHALIGPNGAGKSTLISQLSGTLEPDAGEIRFAGQDLLKVPAAKRAHLGLARSFQVTSLFPEFTALENVALAIQALQGHSFSFLRSVKSDRSLHEPALEVLQTVGLASEAHRQAQTLAHGQQRQLEIAISLALNPKLLLLDEPMAGMGAEGSRTVVDLLQRLKGAVTMLLIEHDMDAVFAVADRVSVLVYGSVIATGTPDEIRQNPEVQTAYLGEHELHVEG